MTAKAQTSPAKAEPHDQSYNDPFYFESDAYLYDTNGSFSVVPSVESKLANPILTPAPKRRLKISFGKISKGSSLRKSSPIRKIGEGSSKEIAPYQESQHLVYISTPDISGVLIDVIDIIKGTPIPGVTSLKTILDISASGGSSRGAIVLNASFLLDGSIPKKKIHTVIQQNLQVEMNRQIIGPARLIGDSELDLEGGIYLEVHPHNERDRRESRTSHLYRLTVEGPGNSGDVRTLIHGLSRAVKGIPNLRELRIMSDDSGKGVGKIIFEVTGVEMLPTDLASVAEERLQSRMPEYNISIKAIPTRPGVFGTDMAEVVSGRNASA
jgi:hypothetical protein